MAGFKVDFFKGLRPRLASEKVKPGEAQTALNVKLGSGDIEPIPEKSTLQAHSRTNPLTIYNYKDDAGDLWFEWSDRVNVARGPIKGDAYNRVYYTGDTLGDGSPKFTTSTRARGAGTGPYPESWYYMGVPAPVSAPTVSVVQLPEDVEAAARVATNLRTDAMVIDKVRYTVYPGTGTDNDTWRLNSAATGSILFDVVPGTAFKVKSIINNNRVTLESATEPGIAMRTENADKTTVNDWHPMDEQGSTKEADFLGFQVPPGMDATIPGHKLGVGDVIVVSAVNYKPQWYSYLTEDFYAQDWETEISVEEDGVTYYEHYNARITATQADTGAFLSGITGGFYYDVDRASSTASELEDRTYVYTYVNDFGEEGPPSPPSAVTPQLDGRKVTISDMAMPPTIGYNVTKMRLYRSNSTEAGTEYQFVKEFDLNRTTTDEVLSEDLGETIPSTTWDPPSSSMLGITAMPNGMMVGFAGRTLYFAEPYFPHAWPPEYDQAIDHEIIGLAAIGNSIAVLTEGWPYIITGSHPRNVNVRPVKVNQACVSAQSICTDGNRVYYASNEGIVELSENGVRVVTEQFMDKDDWASYSPTTMVAEFYEGRYYGFYDFNTSGVADVITAEVAGTITAAEEAEIVEGGLTILLYLTNDSWVASGASFNAVRQDIIDGLADTATSPQSLGWDNLVQTTIAVGDVVRTSDSLVTITLPAVSGYAIDSAEEIQPTIPASALVLSNSAVPTGSTFKVEPDAPNATVTLSGTLDGATEAQIVSGGRTLIITLTEDTWVSSANMTTALLEELVLGLQSSTDETNGWNDTVPQEIDVSTDIVRTSDTVLTITLPAVADYSVTSNETISATIPYQLLTIQEDIDATSANSVGILASGVASAIFSGTAVSGGITENEIITGGDTIIITLTNDTWIAAGTGPIGTTAQSDGLIDAIVAAASPTNGWNNAVLATLSQAHLVRTSSTVATITLPAIASYSIATDETISCTIPADVLTGGSPIGVSNTFGITAQTPATCVLSGTVTGTIDETDIVAGGDTIILTLSNDTWKAAGTGPIGSTADTQAIIDGIDSAQAEGTGWDAVVKAGLVPATHVARTSDTVCTITLPAFGSYDITAQETITATVPAAALNTSASAVVASPTFTVDFDVPTTITVTGTLDGQTNDEVIAGGYTIILTAANDTWVTAGATFDAQRQNIIDGLDAASSPAGGWNNKVRDVIGVGQVVRTSDTVVTITIPATADYDINANEAITVTVPASALTESTIPVSGDQQVNITANSTAVSYIIAGFDNNGTGEVHVSFFDVDYYTEYTGPIASSTTNYPNLIAHSVAEGRWVGYFQNALNTTGTLKELYYSDDDGATWSVTAGTTMTYPSDVITLKRFEAFDYWVFVAQNSFGSPYYEAEYSTDGNTWVDMGTSITANATGLYTGSLGPLYHNSAGIGNHNILMYGGGAGGGSEYMYAALRNSSLDCTFVRSADISGANTPATNWSANFTPAHNNAGYQQAFGSGNGIILYCSTDSSDSYKMKLAKCNHGATSFSAGSNHITGGQYGGAYALQFGNDHWVCIENDGTVHYCDINGGANDETNGNNWSTVSSPFTGTPADLRYDAGTTGTNGQGFVVLTNAGSGSSSKVRIYTSPTGQTWTLRKLFEFRAYLGELGVSHEIDGTDLD